MDIEALGAAVARHWGLGEEMLHMIHRVPLDRPVRTPDTDVEVLRITASAANEAVDAASNPPPDPAAAAGKPTREANPRQSVALRYTRSLGLTPQVVQEALIAARTALRTGRPVQVATPREDMPQAAESSSALAH